MAEFRAPTPLILLAQAGDQCALEELFKGIQEPLYDYLARLVGNPNLAEDVLQEVFVTIWRKLPWLRDPDLFRPWAYRIASREGFRRLKSERSWFRLLDQVEVESIADASTQASVLPEWLDALPELLGALSPASRAVLDLHYLQGLSLDEVAGVLDVSSGTVKSRLSYGLAALRKKLGKRESSHE